MNPGAIADAAGTDAVGLAPDSQVTVSRIPSITTISPGPSRPAAGSTSHARLISRSGPEPLTRRRSGRGGGPAPVPCVPASR